MRQAVFFPNDNQVQGTKLNKSCSSWCWCWWLFWFIRDIISNGSNLRRRW